MSQVGGFSVRIYIPSGEPEGLRIIEKSNWTGKGIVFPRARFDEARGRDEVGRTGVYVLWGFDGKSSLPRAYIGEGESVLQRLEQHAKQKDFWTHAVVFTSKDTNLNKAHVQYLEARLIELTREIKRAELDNSNQPQLPKLSEADRADVEAFLKDMLLCLPLVGVTFFEKPKLESKHKSKVLQITAKGVKAFGVYLSSGFVVRKESEAVKRPTPSIPKYLNKMRTDLLAQGVLEDVGGVYRFAQDYTFSSPSTAAGVVLGRSANGLTEWKDEQGRPLKEM